MKHLFCCWLALGVGALFAQGDIEAARSVLAMPEGVKAHHHARQDIDGDGRPDLVLQVSNHNESRRELRVYLRKESAPFFADPPTSVIEVDRNATAWTAVRKAGSKEREIFLWYRDGAVRASEASERFAFVLKGAFLWQAPDGLRMIPMPELAQDVNGDGLEDLLVPEPGRLRIALQDARSSEDAPPFRFSRQFVFQPRASHLDLARKPSGARRLEGRRRRNELAASTVGIGVENGAPLVSIAAGMAVPVLRDFDGDGRLDVIMRTTENLHVWRQREDGGFAAAADRELAMPFRVNRERDLDLAWSIHAEHLGGGAGLDALFTMKRPGGDKLGSQIILFEQGWKDRRGRGTDASNPLFGSKGFPRQVIPLGGVAVGTRVADVDGDGVADLSLATFAPDGIDLLSSQVGETLDLSMHFFKNRGGQLSKHADLTLKVSFDADDIQEIAADLPVRFFADLNRDGIHELLLRPKARRFEVRPSKRQRGGRFGVGEGAAWSIEWPFEARVTMFGAEAEGPSEIVIQGEEEVWCLTFAN